MRNACLEQVYEMAKRDPRIVFIGSDLGAGVLQKFKAEMPDRFFMEGIQEQNIIGMAAGMALEGKIVYVNTIATFLTRRCFEQIAVDVCLHNLNVRLIGNGGGLVYAPLGPTHMAIEDIALMRSLPNMTILAPADAEEMHFEMVTRADHRGPAYIRLAKGGDPIVTKGIFPVGADVLLVTTGITLGIAREAAKLISSCTILHVPRIKPFNLEMFHIYAERARAIISIEEHSIIGGLGSACAEAIAEAGFFPAKRFKRIGIPDVFPDRYGSQAELLEYYKITSSNIVSTAIQLLGRS